MAEKTPLWWHPMLHNSIISYTNSWFHAISFDEGCHYEAHNPYGALCKNALGILNEQVSVLALHSNTYEVRTSYGLL